MSVTIKIDRSRVAARIKAGAAAMIRAVSEQTQKSFDKGMGK